MAAGTEIDLGDRVSLLWLAALKLRSGNPFDRFTFS